MGKEDIEYKVKKEGLKGEVAVLKEGKEVKVVPAVLFSEAPAEKLYGIFSKIENSYIPQ